MFRPDDSHLELLFEFGLGRDDHGPWRRRLGDALESPAQMWSRQLTWAIEHGFDDRVRLLIGNGVDVRAPLTDGRTPAEHAVTAGSIGLLDDLRRAGATLPAVTAEQRLAGLLLAGDSEAIEDFGGRHGPALAELRRRRPDLVHRARNTQAVRAVAAAGSTSTRAPAVRPRCTRPRSPETARSSPRCWRPAPTRRPPTTRITRPRWAGPTTPPSPRPCGC